MVNGGLMLRVVTLGAALVAAAACADEDPLRQYTFSWPYSAADDMRPRGGTTTGAAVELLEGASPQWEAVQEPGLTAFERDRRAILAMAGGYRTSFDFIETTGFSPGYTPARPYQSWATEYIFVIEDDAEFISLQHIIVMSYVDGAGHVQGPFVQKHWRQDWRYQDTDLHVYAGHGQFERVELDADEVEGRWSQSVYQVDDSPRYEAIGTWDHQGNYSAWQSERTARPLPRRESSVRDDYDVLIGTNRHALTPNGWVHEEDNLKVDLDERGERKSVVAREVGLNRYERIVDFDFAPAETYWERTEAFWADVRAAWREIYRANDAFELAEEAEGRELFVPMFEYAERLHAGEPYDAENSRNFVTETLSDYIEPR